MATTTFGHITPAYHSAWGSDATLYCIICKNTETGYTHVLGEVDDNTRSHRNDDEPDIRLTEPHPVDPLFVDSASTIGVPRRGDGSYLRIDDDADAFSCRFVSTQQGLYYSSISCLRFALRGVDPSVLDKLSVMAVTIYGGLYSPLNFCRCEGCLASSEHWATRRNCCVAKPFPCAVISIVSVHAADPADPDFPTC